MVSIVRLSKAEDRIDKLESDLHILQVKHDYLVTEVARTNERLSRLERTAEPVRLQGTGNPIDLSGASGPQAFPTFKAYSLESPPEEKSQKKEDPL